MVQNPTSAISPGKYYRTAVTFNALSAVRKKRMGMLCLVVVFITLCTFAADRIEWLKKHQVVLGIYFGILSIIASFVSTSVQDPHIFAGLIDAPIMIAGFFFGAVPAMIAG